MKELIDRAREYLADRYLDVADVTLFIEQYVRMHDENIELMNEVGGLQQYIEELEQELNEMFEEGVVAGDP